MKAEDRKEPAREETQAAKQPNILLIVVDTLRLDRAAPLARTLEGFLDYGYAVTPAPWTLPAHVSMLTGLYPSIHESHERADMKTMVDFARIRNDNSTLMTRLKKLGYSTYGYSANNFISTAFGFDGFDVLRNWEVPWHELLFKMDPVSKWKISKYIRTRKLRDLVSPLLHVLRVNPKLFFSTVFTTIGIGIERVFWRWPVNKGLRNATNFVKHTKFKEPFFLFLNILEVHNPYYKNDNLIEAGFAVRSTSTISKEELQMWREGYDKQVEQVVQKLPKLFDSLAEKGVLDNTLVILTSDHGQLLGEHGWIGHGVFLYDELVEVPLLVKYPALAKHIVPKRGQISLANIPNFILDMAEGRNTDASLYSNQVFSESFLSLPKTQGRRICVFTDEGKVTYKLDSNEVEESNINGDVDAEKVRAQLVEKCIKFAGLNENLLASKMSTNH